MALPTRGRVIIETTVGEVDMELWSKVCALARLESRDLLTPPPGNPQDMPQFHCASYGRCEGYLTYFLHVLTLDLGYYDGVIFHR